MIETRTYTMKRNDILILSFLVFTACKSNKHTAESVSDGKNIQENSQQNANEVGYDSQMESNDTIFAQIQRTPCFGRCGIYTATIYTNGYVIYNGEKWVEKEGVYEGTISQKSMDEILKYAQELKYFEMKSEYDNKGVTDLPSTITKLRNEEGLKTIQNRYEGPKELSQFEKYLDSILDGIKWKKME